MGFEPTNGGFADQPWISILLVRLAFTPALLRDFGPYLGPIVPKLFLISFCPSSVQRNRTAQRVTCVSWPETSL